MKHPVGFGSGLAKIPVNNVLMYVLGSDCDCVKCVLRRSSEPASSARCLFQAVRSYLHFSQLSAWLNSTHGTAPQYIGYR